MFFFITVSDWLKDLQALLSTQTTQKNCQHEFKLDEEIGILCQICGFVKTEIKYVSAPFVSQIFKSMMPMFSMWLLYLVY